MANARKIYLYEERFKLEMKKKLIHLIVVTCTQHAD